MTADRYRDLLWRAVTGTRSEREKARVTIARELSDVDDATVQACYEAALRDPGMAAVFASR